MATYQKLWGSSLRAQVLIEPEARSTTQNAQFVARLMRQHGSKSVVVVTSWYHVPRSWVLMKLAVLGQGMGVRVVSADMPPPNLWIEPAFWQEQAKLWLSLASECPPLVRAAQAAARWLVRGDRPIKWDTV